MNLTGGTIRTAPATVQTAQAAVQFLLSLLFISFTHSQTAAAQSAVGEANSVVVLDQVVAVVNNQAILASELDEEIRLSILDPGQSGQSVLTPKRALDNLIARTLIQQQIRQEELPSTEPTEKEMTARQNEIRQQMPACMRENCASDEGWKAFLLAHQLTPRRVEAYLRYRLQILHFIEMRFRQGIRISPQEIESYYRDKLLPQYAPGEEKPALDAVAPRIEEILLQQQVNVLFDDWLRNLRKQGNVEVLDPELEDNPQKGGKAGA